MRKVIKNKRDFQSTIFQKKNRNGWIEIVEAFTAVLLIAGVVLIILNRGYFQKADISNEIYESQLSILREIETNDGMRTEILSPPDSSLPISWQDFPIDIVNIVNTRTPSYLKCVGKICDFDEVCTFEILPEAQGKDIYSQSVIISSTLQQGAVYRKINLFCWVK
jgi:hypothetical protein